LQYILGVDAPQEFASGLDTDLKKLAQQVRVKERA
jgi:hypothetical protein